MVKLFFTQVKQKQQTECFFFNSDRLKLKKKLENNWVLLKNFNIYQIFRIISLIDFSEQFFNCFSHKLMVVMALKHTRHTASRYFNLALGLFPNSFAKWLLICNFSNY